MKNDNFNYDNMSKDELIALLKQQANELNAKDAELNAKDAELNAKDAELNAKDKELNAKDKELKNKNKELKNKNKEVKNKDKEIKQQNKELKINKKEFSVLQLDYKIAQEVIQYLLKVIEDKGIKLKEQLLHRFGIKSDKFEIINGVCLAENETLVNEAELIIETEPKELKKRGRKPHTLDADKFNKELVEYEQVKIDNKPDKCNVCDSTDITFLGTTTYQKVEYIPAKVKVTEYNVYRYQCNSCGAFFDLDEPLNQFDNESFLTPSLASFVVNSKYNYALPLYRIEKMLDQAGTPISRQSLANYCMTIADKLTTLYEKMKKVLLNTSVGVLHADETTERVIVLNDGDKKRQKCYVWLYATSMYDVPIYIYEHKISREGIHPQVFLKDYNGYLVCDDYPGYENIPGVKLARCWYHAKKKYADFIKTIPAKQRKNSEAIKIHNMISTICKADNNIHKKAKSVDEVKTMREENLQPLVLEYFEYIEGLYKKVDKTSALGKAINYSIKNKADLCRFFEDAHIPLTNNLAERGIKPFVIIRKNALFSFTESGSQASCILLSIIQTAKMNLLKPDEYVKYVLENIDDTPTNQIDTLLPWSKAIPESMKYSKKDIERAMS